MKVATYKTPWIYIQISLAHLKSVCCNGSQWMGDLDGWVQPQQNRNLCTTNGSCVNTTTADQQPRYAAPAYCDVDLNIPGVYWPCAVLLCGCSSSGRISSVPWSCLTVNHWIQMTTGSSLTAGNKSGNGEFRCLSTPDTCQNLLWSEWQHWFALRVSVIRFA